MERPDHGRCAAGGEDTEMIELAWLLAFSAVYWLCWYADQKVRGLR